MERAVKRDKLRTTSRFQGQLGSRIDAFTTAVHKDKLHLRTWYRLGENSAHKLGQFELRRMAHYIRSMQHFPRL